MPSSEGKTKSLISKVAPSIDQDLLEYMLGYFEDTTNDASEEAIHDFIYPILAETGAQENEITTLTEKLSEIMLEGTAGVDGASRHNHQAKPLALDTPLQMNQRKFMTLENALQNNIQDSGDIAHTMSKNAGKSIVDKQKLLKAEAKLNQKREKRGLNNDLYQGIPVWNPDVVPPIIVNQVKAQSSLSKDIKLENFDISYAGNIILKEADLALNYGRRYGLVGKNGVGKSTLLRAIARKELLLADHIKILHVEQEIHGDDTKAIVSVLEADTERNELLALEKEYNKQLHEGNLSSEESNSISDKLKDVYAKLEVMEADKAESRAASILAGLGFSPEQQQAATRTFSGGWRMRLALARALFCKPDLLLADEVTNYLDFPAVVWLENYFQNWPATLLVVSHDRSFLDAVSTDILHMHHGKLDVYKGNFTQFVTARAEKVKGQLREYESQLMYRQNLQSFIDRWRYNAKRAAQAQSKIKILEKLPPLEAPPKDEMEGLGEGEANVYFTFNDAEKLSPPILQMNEVTFGYDSKRIILKGISFDLRMDSKIAVVGPNGAGKSTMIHLLTGTHQPQSGIVHRHGRLRVALFSQHHVDQLSLGSSAVQFLTSKFPGYTEEDYRRVLGRYGLSGMTALQPIGTLSGGQKSRVVFAWMAMSNPHVLVLDEPTNHLDMDSIDALSKALLKFNGGIIIVSHDEKFLDTVCNEVWVCQGGQLDKFEGRVGDQDGIVRQYKKSLNLD